MVDSYDGSASLNEVQSILSSRGLDSPGVRILSFHTTLQIINFDLNFEELVCRKDFVIFSSSIKGSSRGFVGMVM